MCIPLSINYVWKEGVHTHTLNDLFDEYIEFCRCKQLRPKTIAAYTQGISLFITWLNQNEKITDIDGLTVKVLRRYILDLQTRGKYAVYASDIDKLSYSPENRADYNTPLTNTTINNYFRYLRAFLLWMEDMEYIARSPMRKLKEIPDQRKPKEYLEDSEVKSLFQSMNKTQYNEYRDLLIMLIMLDCGTRLSETLTIEMAQIDLVKCAILLPAEKTKGRRTRTVFFSMDTGIMLSEWLEYVRKKNPSVYAFPVRKRTYPLTATQYGRNFRKYIERIGVAKRITPHTLRNNFAKRCLLSGMDIYTLSRLLGHSSVTITEAAYLDVKDEELKDSYQKHSPLKAIFHDDDK